MLADALAEAVHAIARVGPLSGDPYRLAGELGMPPWRVQKAQKQSRRWSRDSVAEAMRLVAALNADVKGAAADADYALESAVRKVAELAGEAERAQSLCSALARADFLLAAWFLWMTPLLAALSSLRLVDGQQLGGLVLLAGVDRLAETADGRAQRGLHRLVAQPGALVGEDALLLRLDVGHALVPSKCQLGC